MLMSMLVRLAARLDVVLVVSVNPKRGVEKGLEPKDVLLLLFDAMRASEADTLPGLPVHPALELPPKIEIERATLDVRLSLLLFVLDSSRLWEVFLGELLTEASSVDVLA